MTVFDSLLEVPLDPPEPDGDDRNVPGDEGTEYEYAAPTMLLSAVSEFQNVVVPFRGPFKVGSKSDGVRAMKRAGSHAGYLPWQRFDNTFYERTRKWLVKFQADAHIPASGIYDYATHQKLAPHYDAYAIKYLLDEPVLTPEQKKRNAMLARMMFLYNNRYRYQYTQRRPWDTRYDPLWGLDCSAGADSIAKFSSVPELSGYTSWGWGNTDTMISRLSRLGRKLSGISDARVGDVKFYGAGSDPSHVAVFLGRKDGVSRVWSFGSYPIKILDHGYRHDGIAVYSVLLR